jgi:hypothetical protein
VLRSLTLSVAIARPPRVVYDFVHDVGTWPRWATGFCLAARRDGDGWVIDTVDGPLRLRMTPRNELGVLDHTVTVAPGVDVLNPMRVVANGDGSEVLFTLFQPPGASDERFRDDARLVRGDLITLKSVLEGAG